MGPSLPDKQLQVGLPPSFRHSAFCPQISFTEQGSAIQPCLEKNVKIFFFNFRTLRILNYKITICLPSRWVYLLQNSLAFFLTFYDASFHMKRSFKYAQRIAQFYKVISCFLEWYESLCILKWAHRMSHMKGGIMKGLI